MTIPTIKTAISTLGAILFMANVANADLLSLPEFRPSQENYDLVELACGYPVVRSKKDSWAGFHSTLLFFRSGNVALEINGKKFYETFLIYDSARPTCVQIFTNGPGAFGFVFGTKASKKEETVVLNTPEGHVEVFKSGKIIPLD